MGEELQGAAADNKRETQIVVGNEIRYYGGFL